jgi:hypothetical protein
MDLMSAESYIVVIISLIALWTCSDCRSGRS